MKAKILISACLMGDPVRYDGRGKPFEHPLIARWRGEGRLVGFCPELAGGFQVPRPPAEIADGADGDAVFGGAARVVEIGGADVTAQFLAGAEKALGFARQKGCTFALLIDGSPSCGSGFIYDGSFTGTRHAGNGVTAALLEKSGIAVFTPAKIEELALRLGETSVQP